MKEFQFKIVGSANEAEIGDWYQCSHWVHKSRFSKKNARKPKNWDTIARGESVAGMRHENRWKKFLSIVDKESWELFAVRDRNNRHDPNAIEIWYSAEAEKGMIGFVHQEVAATMSEVRNIAMVPTGMIIPEDLSRTQLKFNIYEVKGGKPGFTFEPSPVDDDSTGLSAGIVIAFVLLAGILVVFILL